MDVNVVVLAGGVSSERAVSLGSGRACAQALACSFPTRLIDVREAALPEGLDPRRDVVYSTLHGTFGEDGGMQSRLDAAGVPYAGCDAAASALTFDKERTKGAVRAAGIAVAAACTFTAEDRPTAAELVAQLGAGVVIKPQRGGSSVGLAICQGEAEVAAALAGLAPGAWMAEQRIIGREVTVAVLGERALPVVEIAPKSGVFDYAAKYTKGMTEYIAPARVSAEMSAALQAEACAAFRACGCRDYARIDFMITPENDRILLEINTLPGMKETSLFPMGAHCAGLDFTTLVRTMIGPALERRSLGNREGGHE